MTDVGQAVGKLILRRKLAEGGMGAIWVGYDQDRDREVAVKLLTLCRMDDDESVRRFQLEASIATRIRSPHVPEVFAHGIREDGTPYLVMELVDGVDLATWLAKYGRPSLKAAGKLVHQVGLALTAAHDLGVIHRDVKPSNIIMTGAADEFHAYLIDFGIAKATNPTKSQMLTHPGTTVGTPSYMSPEQLVGEGRVDERADVWALAVVAYSCVTGKLPFVGETFRDLCLAIYCGQFTCASVERADLPPALDDWFAKGLCTELEGRFRTVAAATDAFQRATRSTEEAARDSSASALRSTVPSFASLACALPARQLPRASRRATATCAVGGAALGAAAAFFISTSGSGSSGAAATHEKAVAADAVLAPDASHERFRGPSGGSSAASSGMRALGR